MMESQASGARKQATSNVSPIPKQPELASVRLLLVILACLLVEIITQGVISFQPFLSLARGQVIPEWILFGVIGFCIAFTIVRNYGRLRALQGLDRQRIALARGKAPRTISGELASQVGASPLLAAITLIPLQAASWRWMWYIALSLEAFCLLFLIDGLVAGGLFMFSIIELILATLLIALFVLNAFYLRKAEITVEARERGLQVERRGHQTLITPIAWEEARLFVCYSLPDLFLGQSKRFYELSSSTHVATWEIVPEKMSSFTVWKPALSAGEYQLQMQVLCELITASTGLALCDLTTHETATLST